MKFADSNRSVQAGYDTDALPHTLSSTAPNSCYSNYQGVRWIKQSDRTRRPGRICLPFHQTTPCPDNPFLLKNLPYDTAKDFTGVGLVANTPYVLAVAPSLPVSTPKELIDYLKRHPDKATVAVTSIGSAQHISAALFRKMSGVDMVFVPYKGSAAQIADVSSGRVPVAFDNIVAIAGQIRAGAQPRTSVRSRNLRQGRHRHEAG